MTFEECVPGRGTADARLDLGTRAGVTRGRSARTRDLLPRMKGRLGGFRAGPIPSHPQVSMSRFPHQQGSPWLPAPPRHGHPLPRACLCVHYTRCELYKAKGISLSLLPVLEHSLDHSCLISTCWGLQQGPCYCE